MSQPVIQLEKVGIGFNGENLLHDVNLTIAEAETLVLIGPSGQGKTVLLKLMAGLLEPDQGQVSINGQNLAELKGKQREKILQQTGMLFQKNALFDSLTVGDNIAFPLRETTDLSDSEINGRIDEFLQAVGIAHAKALYPDEISGGMQKRLGIARALALQPKIVFYDDPTAGLDPITSRKIIELIRRLKEEDESTVVAITNDMNRAYQMADRIAMVIDGELILTGDVKQTQNCADPRVQQFIKGLLHGPLTAMFEEVSP